VKRQERREMLEAYAWSLGIAFVIGCCITPFAYKDAPIAWPLMLFGSTFCFGTGFFLLGAIRSQIRIPWFLLNAVVQTALTAITVLGCLIPLVWYFLSAAEHHLAPLSDLLQLLSSSLSFKAQVAGIFLAFLITMGFEFSRKLGPGVLWNWLTGKYYTPREEELVFMFLDMKDSTTIAERLGALKFSALVRDFFRDLSAPLQESKGRVSHYIGDEAVIYWKPENAVKPTGCIAFFFAFKKALNGRADYYQKTYGLTPEFKAGLHIGPVVATEVGDVKSEIVFHGDVLNTTARIESMCNEIGSEFLVSRVLADRLKLPAGVSRIELGAVHLKGKAEEVDLVSIIQS
jgi:adenylate cyclase